jgi:catechol 1,2-dioxygenase
MHGSHALRHDIPKENAKMSSNLSDKSTIRDLAWRAAGLDNQQGDLRLKTIMNRLLTDLFQAIDDLDIQMNEVWAAVDFIGRAAKANELGLIVPSIALEHFLDLRLDEAERRAGMAGGTVRTIEGPLYVAGAPLAKHEARLDDGSDDGEVLFMEGLVISTAAKPIPGAIVDVWHANTMGNYSFFGPPQSPYNLRRRIETDSEGRYRFRSIMPSGYNLPPGSNTEALMTKVGRHGRRPAHVHFFVTAPGYRQLTTQINIAGDEYLYEDVAFGTRNELIPAIQRVTDADEIHKAGVNKPFAKIKFDFVVTKEIPGVPSTVVHREHAAAT